MKKSTSALYSGVYGIFLLLISLTFAWALMLKFDFFYGTWHDYGGIKEGIEKYGPKNRYKPGFAATSREQRIEIFGAISRAVHNSGRGLEDISYQSVASGGRQLLLREPEILHLQDVARLINFLMAAMAFVFIAWPVLAVVYFRRRGRLPAFKFQALGLAALLVTVGLTLVVFGAENVFNTLHVWIFPDDHQWFFYYQESLMSTMMLAPRLFAWIAGAWALLSFLIFIVLSGLLRLGVRIKG